MGMVEGTFLLMGLIFFAFQCDEHFFSFSLSFNGQDGFQTLYAFLFACDGCIDEP